MASTVEPDERVGIIVPPPEVKGILETTATYVGKKPALEARVLQKHNQDPRFSFLKVSDPYYAYYCSKVAEARAAATGQPAPVQSISSEAEKGKEIITEGQPLSSKDQIHAKDGQVPSASQATADDEPVRGSKDAADEKMTTSATAKVSFLKSIRAKEEAARQEPREPPPEDLFTLISMAPQPHALGLEVMKLAAQFVAKNGREFLTALRSKESRNSLFDFLRPMHPHFIVFQRLVDAYRAIMTEGNASNFLPKGHNVRECEKAIMQDVWYMHDWECLRAEREHDAAMDESEKVKAAQIDWYDFVVLETVDIDDDETNLPAPVADAKQLPKILAATRKLELEREKNRGDVDMDIDTDETPNGSVLSQTTEKHGMVVTVEADTALSWDRIRKEPTAIPVKQVNDVRVGSIADEPTVVLPSGQRVPLSQAEASMRAELLNPSYKDERARAAAKNRKQNLARGEEMARHLARWEQQRTEGGVYNRGDLQEALATQPKSSAAEADVRLKKAERLGPKLPGMEIEELSPPAKRRRVEAAKEALEKAAKKKAAETAAAEEEAAVAEAAGIATEEKLPGLMTADEWLQKQGQHAQVRIKMPSHSNKEWKLQGQEMELKAPLKKMVSNLKKVIEKWTKLPAKKQKLHMEGAGFLKDKMTLAFYNVSNETTITLEVKERGGRKRNH
ncbi:Splicing factor 3A subunit 1, SF3-A [Chondrus crispus]|uniref:Splicing factor 3A subunit 1, SF3-A n=1 Tax=Chondrus crispus TaxID=2769 RepID=R7QGI3_CHOCR|nr:Splicing factor 3A subunit 1, SF3-A [Chondrus crispus]CDF36505.1 Splicing factor 3A subunit 1, SF3-A [Chondrus crispus]|eukprot:XP_005716324.1 Splicing factor 3A subunit 1, SF3-A [Chondrus crispus]